MSTTTILPMQIAEIASAGPACSVDAGQEIVDLLTTARPYAAASIAVYDPLLNMHRTMASTGYDERVLDHLNGWMISDDRIYQIYKRQGRAQRALRWADMPFPYHETYLAQEVFHPAGFVEGITLRLHSYDGRYTGNLHISTDDPRYPTHAMLDTEVQQLQTLLGNFADSLGLLANRLDARPGSATGCVITSDGRRVPLPGLPLLDSRLHEALARRLAPVPDGLVPGVFYLKHDRTWFRVLTSRVGGGSRLVAAEPTPLPFGLTARELEIIDLLLTGAPNDEIASLLFVTRATVAKHLENIYSKLECPNRTAVVTTALLHDLRVLPVGARGAA